MEGSGQGANSPLSLCLRGQLLQALPFFLYFSQHFFFLPMRLFLFSLNKVLR